MHDLRPELLKIKNFGGRPSGAVTLTTGLLVRHKKPVLDGEFFVLHDALFGVVRPGAVTRFTGHTFLEVDLFGYFLFSKIISRRMAFEALGAVLRVLDTDGSPKRLSLVTAQRIKSLGMRGSDPYLILLTLGGHLVADRAFLGANKFMRRFRRYGLAAQGEKRQT